MDCFKIGSTLWWEDYGADGPKLQQFAIHILSQGCSSSCLEQLWSMYSHIAFKKRNHLGVHHVNHSDRGRGGRAIGTPIRGRGREGTRGDGWTSPVAKGTHAGRLGTRPGDKSMLGDGLKGTEVTVFFFLNDYYSLSMAICA